MACSGEQEDVRAQIENRRVDRKILLTLFVFAKLLVLKIKLIFKTKPIRAKTTCS